MKEWSYLVLLIRKMTASRIFREIIWAFPSWSIIRWRNILRCKHVTMDGAGVRAFKLASTDTTLSRHWCRYRVANQVILNVSIGVKSPTVTREVECLWLRPGFKFNKYQWRVYTSFVEFNAPKMKEENQIEREKKNLKEITRKWNQIRRSWLKPFISRLKMAANWFKIF